MIGDMVLLLDVLAGEVALFAAVMMLVGGIDDLLVDALLWQCGDAPRPLSTLPAAPPLRYAVFVPAWHEAAVIGAMLEAAASSYDLARLRLYVGCYPNDPATLDAVRTIIPRSPAVRIVVGDRLGPTNKADCLVTLWHAMRADEAAGHARYDAVILHDAEDCIDPAELSVFDHHLRHAAAVQLPVVPLIEPRRHWVSGGYADEFAEAHMRTLVVRQALGASLPLAGVGCALRRDVLERIAAGDGEPFDASSLTEDYELGLRIGALGYPVTFVRWCNAQGSLIATSAYFPERFGASVRQRSRWIAGIALAGWDRTGWGRRHAAERWMRMRDRRGPLAALVIALAYAALLLQSLSWLAHRLHGDWPPAVPSTVFALSIANLLLLSWRITIRVRCTAALHGRREGLRSIPRLFVGNALLIAAVATAMREYVRSLVTGRPLRWDKTEHRFPGVDCGTR